jgi:lysophospholipid acyltransferase (LPLAT)-like uncharacterized protein
MEPPASAPRRSRPIRRLRKAVARVLVAIAVAIVPRLYVAYMRFVWATSRVEILGCNPHDVRAHYGKQVILLWHEEVFFVAWAFRQFRPSTLASRGDFGELVTRMLELCDFEVFRGGSSSGRSRRSPQIVRDLAEHMSSKPGVLYGITVDGSNGPRYRAKPGAAKIAALCRAPVLVEKTWCRRSLRLPTWDRTIVPLPFNHVVHVFAGPYLPPADVDQPRAFKEFARSIERELWRLTRSVIARMEGPEAIPSEIPEVAEAGEVVLVRPFDPVPVPETPAARSS